MTWTVADWMESMAAATARLDALGALEGAAGNVSLFLPGDTPGLATLLDERWTDARPWPLAPGETLPPGALLISGTGRRLRDIAHAPDATLCAIHVTADGQATVRRAPGHAVEPTTEVDTHLGAQRVGLTLGPAPHAVIHAQPRALTYLSHIPAYRDERRLARQLYRWQPETLVALPEGPRVLPYQTPGTPEQGRLTTTALASSRVVVWARHGVVARSHGGPQAAADLIDYLEAAAAYEVTDLQAGRPADGLTLDELRGIAARFGVSPALLDTLPEAPLR